MLVASILTKLLWALRYPSYPATRDLVGPHPVGAIRTRIPGSVACQIHYPAAVDYDTTKEFHPFFRPEAVDGVGDYARTNPALLQFLCRRKHPCLFNAEPLLPGNDNGKGGKGRFPLVIFSHGLGGCMEMYTLLCREIASQGFCVVALEHEDGSGCHAETADGRPILYKRPDDTPYSREKVTNFRRPFLQQRVEETTSAMQYLLSPASQSNDDEEAMGGRLHRILSATDTSRGCHLLGHSFGGASMVMTHKKNQNDKIPILSLSVLDPWAFSLEDEVLRHGVKGVPLLSILSESWLTNPETTQVQQLLRNSDREKVASFYVPDSVHASFADSVGWLPSFILRKMNLRGKNEKKFTTMQNTAMACVQHIRDSTKDGSSGAALSEKNYASALLPYPVASGKDASYDTALEPHEEPIDAY
mmetsp:Transcript_24859/g.35066  ORF Transcript_24859/g.35066 Transcript_24859/m.35066 type:complete len:417 (-) Transcript_24859:180-1430(-)